ncbi:MAG: hypothetical protein K8S94_15530 [Planctomycetia bacterium]|nr:hypothetical protein [Planctomycetia bacterium]
MLRFARGLRELAAEAEDLEADAIESRLRVANTRNLETRFRNRLRLLATTLREKQSDFDALVTKHGSGDYETYSLIVRELEQAGLATLLKTLTNEVEAIASRSRTLVGTTAREDLQEDLRIVCKLLAGLYSIADEIERQVRTLKQEHASSTTQRSALPKEIEEVLLDSEAAARLFLATVASRPISFDKQATHSTLRWVQDIEAERKRVFDAAERFERVLSAFTDTHRELANKSGQQEAERLIADVLQITQRVRARRNIGQAIIRTIVHGLREKLSLSDRASEAAGRVGHLLGDIERRLAEEGVVLARQEEHAQASRRAQQAHNGRLPEWTELDSPGKDKLRLLIKAFFECMDDDGRNDFTKIQLQARLQGIRPRSQSWDSHTYRWLKKATDLGVVIPSPPDKNRRVAHRFRLSDAAIEKYRAAAIESR